MTNFFGYLIIAVKDKIWYRRFKVYNFKLISNNLKYRVFDLQITITTVLNFTFFTNMMGTKKIELNWKNKKVSVFDGLLPVSLRYDFIDNVDIKI